MIWIVTDCVAHVAEYNALTARLNAPPVSKFLEPLTSSQEYGWDANLLIPAIKDKRFYHPHVASEITRLFAQSLKQ